MLEREENVIGWSYYYLFYLPALVGLNSAGTFSFGVFSPNAASTPVQITTASNTEKSASVVFI
jgi:hypothetical protein